MEPNTYRAALDRLLSRVRRRVFLRTFSTTLTRACLFIFPFAAIAVAASERWQDGKSTVVIAASALAAAFIFSLTKSLLGLGDRVRLALAFDEAAKLKDRVSSAFEFLDQEKLGEPEKLQIEDAISRAEKLDVKSAFPFRWPKFAGLAPVAVLLFALSFFVPPFTSPTTAKTATDSIKQAQLQQLKELQQELQSKEETPEELEQTLKQLEKIQRQFEKGEIGEREVMLQLARLDENLRQKTAELGTDKLEAELNTVVPHLMAASATAEMAMAIKENKMDKAEDELKKLAEKMKAGKLGDKEKRELQVNMGVCSSKLGGKQSGFGSDFASAGEALEKSDSQKFESACKSMCNKLSLVKKCRSMKSCCNKIGLCKSCLGQCDSKELGFKAGLKQQGNKKGGLKAGTAASGDPFGEANRMADSFRKAMKISGEAGESGAVESETEITEGQMSESQLDLKEVHANYAAAAEEVIEKEDIPLSHRYHVKRYFQAIRPQE